jgi:hypothetical protein
VCGCVCCVAGVFHCPKATLEAVQAELALLREGEEYEEVEGAYVFDKRTMRSMEVGV